MSKPPRIDRKAIKGPDEFQKKGRVFLHYLIDQRVRFLSVIIAVGVGVAAVLGWDSFTGNRLDKGWVAYDQAVKAPETERWDKLKTMYGEWGNTRPTYFAAVTLADHFFDDAKKELLKDPTKPVSSAGSAIEWYTKAMQFDGALPSEKQLLTINLGNAYELQQKYDDALASYNKAVDMEGGARGYALLNVARAQELRGDTAKAVDTYQKVSVDFINTEYAKVAKNQLRRMKSPLFANAKK